MYLILFHNFYKNPAEIIVSRKVLYIIFAQPMRTHYGVCVCGGDEKAQRPQRFFRLAEQSQFVRVTSWDLLGANFPQIVRI